MRTAQVAVLLTAGARPRAQATLAAAADTFQQMAGATPPIESIRFVGYDNARTPANAPHGARCALYEADYT